MLTELAVVLCLDFVSIALAALLARWTFRRGTPGPEARRLVSAATRASEAFLLREGKLALAGTALASAVVFGIHAAALIRKSSPALTLTLWSVFATVLGSALTCIIAYLTAAVGLRATLRTVRAAQVGLDQAATLALRAGGIAALSAEALSAASVAGVFGLVYLLAGGGAVKSPADAALLLEHAARVLPGFGLGSVAAAIVLGLGGAAYHVAAAVGALGASGLDPADPRNPSMVAALVGDHVGTGVRRAVDMFAAATLANVAAVTLGVAALKSNAGVSGTHAWALVTLPFVIRGVGVLASAFGLFSARVKEAERAAAGLWRGQISATILLVGGIVGAALWLVGNPDFGWIAGAGISGVLAAAAIGHLSRRTADRRFGAVQEMLEASRAGQASVVARALAVGCRGVLGPAVLLSGSLGTAFQLGERAHVPGGGLLATATALSGFLSASGYVLAMGLFGPIASGAIGIAALEPEAARPEVRRRAVLLDDAGFAAGRVSESFFIALGGAAAVVSGLGIPLVSMPPIDAAAFSLSKGTVVWSGALGAAVVVAFAGRALGVATRAARAAGAEIERQLRVFPREGGVLRVPEDYTPSYRTIIDLASRLSVEGLVPAVALGLAGPLLLGFGLRVLYMSPALAAEGLTAFVVIAAVTGLGAALVADGASAVLGATHRESRPRGSSSGFEAALTGDQVGRFIGDMAAPAAHLFVKALAAAALVIAPLLAGS